MLQSPWPSVVVKSIGVKSTVDVLQQGTVLQHLDQTYNAAFWHHSVARSLYSQMQLNFAASSHYLHACRCATPNSAKHARARHMLVCGWCKRQAQAWLLATGQQECLHNQPDITASLCTSMYWSVSGQQDRLQPCTDLPCMRH